MLSKQRILIDLIHVPSKRTKTLDGQKVLELAEDFLVHGQKVPIRLRPDGKRFVLIEGYHRLEALRALGEDSVEAYLVGARLH